MKRYLLFRGRDYYPSGGIDDLIGDFDSLDECIALCRKDMIKDFTEHPSEYRDVMEVIDYEKSMSWGYIYDCVTREKVWDQNQIMK